MKIAMCASEVVPFAKTGGLADVTGALPLALEETGQEVIIILPRYKGIAEPKFKIKKTKKGHSYSELGKGIKAYFIEDGAYFNREGLYGTKDGDYPDNLERFSFYCKSSLELLKDIDFKPDIIHVHDWQASLIPVYLRTVYRDDPFYQDTRTVLTIHNIGYQGLFSKEEFPKLGLDWGLFHMEALEFYGKVNILKGGMFFCDVINTVSETYSREIQTQEFGYGLDGVLSKRRNEVFGILNGLDYRIWDPKKDKFIAKNYSLDSIEDKYINKKDLLKICGFTLKKGLPLFGVVSRLAEQKGLDILSAAMRIICKKKLQMVILGTGDAKYHKMLKAIVRRYPGVVSLHLKFDDSLAHKIYAGSDIFLMPSKYEPCGLGQLISLRYGTVPLVFKTGGLSDTITEDNGFVFDKYTKEDLVNSVDKVLQAYLDPVSWLQLVKRAMQYNFSWEASAKKYLKLYERAKSSQR